MIIKREINGQTVEIELTPNELYQAFVERSDNFDIDDICEYADWFDDTRDIELTGDQLARAAKKYRKWLNDWDTLGEAQIEFAHDAIREVARQDGIKLNGEEE